MLHDGSVVHVWAFARTSDRHFPGLGPVDQLMNIFHGCNHLGSAAITILITRNSIDSHFFSKSTQSNSRRLAHNDPDQNNQDANDQKLNVGIRANKPTDGFGRRCAALS
jgi:hypothetical protein